jgi:hypothetical protein
MSLGRITRVPIVESCPSKMAAETDRGIAERGDAIPSFASFLNRAESSPLHTDVDGSRISRVPKEKILLLLERKRTEMNLRLLKSLGEEGETPAPVPDALGMFVTEGIRDVADGSEASKSQQKARKYDGSPSYEELVPIIRQASEVFGVDQDLVRAVIKTESSFRALSTSPKGARGLMQLMPETALEMGVKDSYDPVENIMGGTRYLRGLLNRYQGNIPRVLAAYIWGPGNVDRYPDRLPQETREYITRVTEEYGSAKV